MAYEKKVYVEMIEPRIDALGRQVFFLGFEDDKAPCIRFQVFNDVLKAHIEKWETRGYEIVHVKK